MKHIMTINGHQAVIEFDGDLKLFRGEFTGLNGGADFYADSIEGLEREGVASLTEFLATCKEHGIEPYRHFSGKFQVRTDKELHAKAVEVAAARKISLNQLITEALRHELSLA